MSFKCGSFERGAPEPRRKPISGTGSSESLGMGTHPSPHNHEVINGPEGHESDPVHVVRALRTLHPRRLEIPIGINNLGEASQIRQNSAIAEQAQLESTEQRDDGRRPDLRGGRKLWSEREIATLRNLCEAYGERQVCWKEVQRKFSSFHEQRTVAALATKWGALKRLRAPMVGAPPTLDHDPETGSAGEGDGGGPSQEGRPADDPIPAKGPAEGKDSDVRPVAVCGFTDSGEHLMKSDVRPPAVVRLAESEQHTMESSVKPGATDGRADLEEHSKEEDIEQKGIELEGDPRFRAFRKAFYGYFRWAVSSFDREPVKRVRRDCPKVLYAYADYLISTGYSKALGPNQSRIGRLNGLVYAAARTIHQFWRDELSQRQLGEKGWYTKTKATREDLQMLISMMESELARRKEKRKPVAKELENIHKLVGRLGTRSTSGIVRRLEMARQRLKLLEDRISVREQEKRRKRLRKQFAETPSLKLLTKGGNERGGTLVIMKSVMDFWKPIIGRRSSSDPDRLQVLRDWREEQKKAYPPDLDLEKADLEEKYEGAIRRVQPWKAPGPDGLHAHWWKALPSAKRLLGELVVDWLTTGKVTTGWVCRGRTILIPKKGNRSDPSNYRPITCLNTCYKVLTSVMNSVILSHLSKGEALPKNQRALRKREWACTHAMILDRAIIMDAMAQKKHSISVAWLDYSKAYDSVSHEYLRWAIDSVNIPRSVQLTLRRLMSDWETRFELVQCRPKLRSDRMKVLNGIFQGDSLSPTLFVLCIAPISYALNKGVGQCQSSSGWSAGYGFEIGHQFYMDDLKLYARTPAMLDSQIQVVSKVSEAVGLHLNLSKCAKAHYAPHGASGAQAVEDAEGLRKGEIPVLGLRNTYKYLGVEQRLLTAEGALEEFEASFLNRADTIFASELTWGQMATTYNTIAIAGLRYVYSNTNGASPKLLEALKRAATLDTRIRDLLRRHKCRFRNSFVERLYIPREYGGYGLKSVEDTLRECILATWSYIATNPSLASQQYFFERLAARGKRTPMADGVKVLLDLGVEPQVDLERRKVTVDGIVFDNPTKLHRYLVGKLLKERTEARIRRWKEANMAGRLVNDTSIDIRLSCLWMKKAFISARNLRDAIAVQEGSLFTRACVASRGKGSRETCRCCHAAPETAEHITSACRYWLPSLYVERHDSVARNLYYAICCRYGITPVHYSNKVSPLSENSQCRVLWNMDMQTRTPMKHRRPDIVVFDLKREKILMFEVSVAHASGLLKQREIKINRYTVNSEELPDETITPYPPGPNLAADLAVSYGWQVEFAPVVVGTCGEHVPAVKEDLQRTLDLKPHQAESLLERISRSAVIGTARVVRAHLACS